MKICLECGKKADANFCPDCGKPMTDFVGDVAMLAEENIIDNVTDNNYQIAGYSGPHENESVESMPGDTNLDFVTPENVQPPLKKKMNKKVIVIIAAIIVLAIIASIPIVIHLKDKQQKAEYVANLNAFVTTALQGATEAEDLCNLTKSVWHDAIYEDSDEETEKYVEGVEDFNEALLNLYLDDSTIETVSVIEDNQKKVEEYMKKLKNPPGEYAQYYSLAVEFYGKYKAFTDLAMDPEGSYNSYTDKVNDLDSEVAELYEKLNTMIPTISE